MCPCEQIFRENNVQLVPTLSLLGSMVLPVGSLRNSFILSFSELESGVPSNIELGINQGWGKRSAVRLRYSYLQWWVLCNNLPVSLTSWYPVM